MIMTEGDIVSEGDVDVEEETVLRNYDYISSNLLTVNTIPPNHVFFPTIRGLSSVHYDHKTYPVFTVFIYLPIKYIISAAVYKFPYILI